MMAAWSWLLAAYGAAFNRVETRMYDRFLYFGYGSNMLNARLIARTASAVAYRTGHVTRRRLTFSKISDDRSGKCDAEFTGIKLTMSRACCSGSIARKKRRSMMRKRSTAGTMKRSWRSSPPTAASRRTPMSLPQDRPTWHAAPHHWDKALVIAGAVQHRLPATNIDALRAVPSLRDPNAQPPDEARG